MQWEPGSQTIAVRTHTKWGSVTRHYENGKWVETYAQRGKKMTRWAPGTGPMPVITF